jgi:hypothetical protein
MAPEVLADTGGVGGLATYLATGIFSDGFETEDASASSLSVP